MAHFNTLKFDRTWNQLDFMHVLSDIRDIITNNINLGDDFLPKMFKTHTIHAATLFQNYLSDLFIYSCFK